MTLRDATPPPLPPPVTASYATPVAGTSPVHPHGTPLPPAALGPGSAWRQAFWLTLLTGGVPLAAGLWLLARTIDGDTPRARNNAGAAFELSAMYMVAHAVTAVGVVLVALSWGVRRGYAWAAALGIVALLPVALVAAVCVVFAALQPNRVPLALLCGAVPLLVSAATFTALMRALSSSRR